MSRLHFCNFHIIHHNFCDTSPILILSCEDTLDVERMIILFAGSTLTMSFLIICASYVSVLCTVLKISFISEKQKALYLPSPVSHHLLWHCDVYLFKTEEVLLLGKDQVASVCHTIVIPMLNLLIDSLRKKEVKKCFD
jgi:olfactory receptor